MLDIVYIKLVNGEELFANRISEEEGQILLDNVMCMETIHTEADSKYMFMVRYTQYCTNHSMVLDRSQIIFINAASEIVSKHYLTSVSFAEDVSDDRFTKSISDANKYLTAVLKEKEAKIDTSSSTKH
jgi:hypothetical protein